MTCLHNVDKNSQHQNLTLRKVDMNHSAGHVISVLVEIALDCAVRCIRNLVNRPVNRLMHSEVYIT